MAEKNQFYKDFSTRSPFNNIACSKGEILKPVVLTKDNVEYLKTLGLDWDNCETWKFPYSNKKVPVAFIPIREDQVAANEAIFNANVRAFLGGNPDETSEEGVLSLDKFLDDIEDENGKGYDPTGSTKDQDNAFIMMVLEMLIADLDRQGAKYGSIFRLLYEGHSKGDIIKLVGLDQEKGKSQAYAYIDKVQKAAAKLYTEKYQ